MLAGGTSQARALWSDPTFRSLSVLPQNLFQLIVTGPFRLAVPGILHVMGGLSTLSGVLGQPRVEVSDAMAQLGTNGFVEWDERSEVIVVPGSERFSASHCKSPNHLRGWWQAWQQIPDSELKTHHQVAIRQCFPGLEVMPNAWDLWGNTFAPGLTSYLREKGLPEERIRAFVGPTSRPVVRPLSKNAPRGALVTRSGVLSLPDVGEGDRGSENASGLVLVKSRIASSNAGRFQLGHRFAARAAGRSPESLGSCPDLEREREIKSLSLSKSPDQTRARVEQSVSKNINDICGSDGSDPCDRKNINDICGSEALPKLCRSSAPGLRERAKKLGRFEDESEKAQ